MNNQTREYILSRTTEIRKTKQKFFLSNIFGVPDSVEQVEENEHAITFCIDDKGVKRVYFSANNQDALKELLAKFPAGCGIEIIDRKMSFDFENMLYDAGYKSFAIYLRATNSKLKDTFDKKISKKFADIDCDRYADQATLSDLEDIYALLYDTFNPLTSHLQNRAELKEDIENEQILIARTGDELQALLTYEYQGRKLYMEHMINRGESILMHSLYFKTLKSAIDKEINLAYTWMRKDNGRALAFAGRYGLVPDGIKNFVYVKGN